jgi:glutaredoxin
MHCKALKSFLKEHSIEYDYIDVDKLEGREREDVLSDMRKISGDMRFPTIIIGDKVIMGFYQDKVREALGL